MGLVELTCEGLKYMDENDKAIVKGKWIKELREQERKQGAVEEITAFQVWISSWYNDVSQKRVVAYIERRLKELNERGV
jgi:hypothetical protein